MKRIALAVLLAACAKYKAPPPVPKIEMPSGAALAPFDSNPSLARPTGIAVLGGKAFVSLGNYDAAYVARGPGLLAALVPSTGALETFALGGSDGHRCLEPFWIRDAGGKLYVSCSGYTDYGSASPTLQGAALLEVDPGTGAVTRSVALPTSPAGLAITASGIWFGDAFTGNVYAVDRTSFTVASGPIAIPCPATGNYVTTSDVILVQGDLYTACSNDTGGILSRLDAATGALKMQTDSGPIATEFTETGDGRIAIVSGGDNKLRLVTIGSSALTTAVAYTFSDSTSTLQDVHANGQFLFTAASGSNTVQKLDLTRTGAQMLAGEANIGPGAAPYSIVPLDDDQALVANQSGNTVVSVSSDCSGGKLCWTVPK